MPLLGAICKPSYATPLACCSWHVGTAESVYVCCCFGFGFLGHCTKAKDITMCHKDGAKEAYPWDTV